MRKGAAGNTASVMRFAPAGFPLQAYLADSGSAFSVFEISGVLPSILTSAHPKFFVSACDGKFFQAISYAHLEATCGVVEAEPDWLVNKILDPVSSAYSDSAYCASALLPDGTAVCLCEAGAQIACARSNREWITSCKAAFPSHSPRRRDHFVKSQAPRCALSRSHSCTILPFLLLEMLAPS